MLGQLSSLSLRRTVTAIPPSYAIARPCVATSLAPLSRLLPRAYTRPTSTSSSATLSPSETDHLEPKAEGIAASDDPVGYLYFDSLYPIKLGFWDVRHLFVRTDHRILLDRLKAALPDQSQVPHSFRIIGAEERLKDGGAFLSFTYSPAHAPPPAAPKYETRDEALLHIEDKLKSELKRSNNILERALLSWGTRPSVHVVRGKPWLEDLNRFPALRLKVTLSGGDLSEEALWGLLRPYGRIASMDKKAGEAMVLFSRMRSATSARNCAHGLVLPDGTKLTINYAGQERAKQFWDWTTNHPRIVLPVLAFLLGGFTYAIFDPVRAFFIETKLSHTFELGNYRLYAWLKRNTVDLLIDSDDSDERGDAVDWFERRAARESIQGWLREKPETFITIAGPRGSGKHKLLEAAVPKDAKTLTIDCATIAKAVGGSSSSSSAPSKPGSGGDGSKMETALVSALASETGYWPVFGWLNSLNSMIDLAVVGLIGSKAGFSRPIEEQLGQVLEVTTQALASAGSKDAKKAEVERKRREKINSRKQSAAPAPAPAPRPAEAKHAGGASVQTDAQILAGEDAKRHESGDEISSPEVASSHQRDPTHAQAPVVIIDNFHLKSLRSPLLYSVLVSWASSLVSSGTAHVIFVSDNPVAMSKEIGRALPDSSPANNVVLADAEQARARDFVRSRLSQDASRGTIAEKAQDLLPEADAAWVDKLGGRLTDLENLLQKVSLGQDVPTAVSEIISRSIVELRKSFFGDDSTESSTLPWSRGTAWAVIRLLTQSEDGSVPYHWMLHSDSGAFKGDEGKLRAMEEAELISVRHKDGRPSVIRAGRPVLLEAMRELVRDDKTFRLTQDYLDAKAGLAKSEAGVRALEGELKELVELTKLGGRGVAARMDSLAKKLEGEQGKVQAYEDKVGNIEAELKRGS